MEPVEKLRQDTAHYLTLSPAEKEIFIEQQNEAISAMTPAGRQAQVAAIYLRVQQIAAQLENTFQPAQSAAKAA